MANLIIVFYVKESHRAWRILTNTVLIPTIPLMVIIYLMPESPRYGHVFTAFRLQTNQFCRYLMKHGFYKGIGRIHDDTNNPSSR